MSLQQEWSKIQQSYDTVRFKQIEKNTEAILKHLRSLPKKMTEFKDTTTILARQLCEGETITISDKTKKIAKRGQWLVHDETHKQKILEEVEFEYYYDKDNPVKGEGAVKMYKPTKKTFTGMLYEGKSIDVYTSNKGLKTIFPGYYVGILAENNCEKIEVYDSKEFQQRFVRDI